MSEELHDALTEINGVGDARADDIIELVDEYGAGVDVDALRDDLEDALSYHEQGDHEYAATFVESARDRLE